MKQSPIPSIPVLLTGRHDAIKLAPWLSGHQGPILCSSPDAFLLMVAVGLGDRASLIDSPLPSDLLPQVESQANALARELDRSMSRVLKVLLGREVSEGWEFWDKLFFAQSLGALAEWMHSGALTQLPNKVAMCHFQNPQDYFHPSVIRANVIAKALKKSGREVARIPLDYPLRLPHRPDVWRCVYRLEIPRGALEGARLVHCPSVLYAGQELQKLYSGPGFIDLQSPFYDVEIGRYRIRLCPPEEGDRGLPVPTKEAESLYRAFIGQLGLDSLSGIDSQLDHWQQRLCFQIRAFKMLAMLRSRYGISLEAIADHDGGLFGPLCSAFRGQTQRLTLYPHSTISVGPLPGELPVRTLAWMSALQPYQPFDGGVIPFADFAPNAARPAPAGSTVALVLNEFDNVGGVAVHGYQSLVSFVENLAAALLARGYRPVLRPRPSSPVHLAHSFKIELHEGDLTTLIQRAGVCIGIGQVTTALLKFWREGVHCFHVQEAGLSISDSYTLPREGVGVFAGKPFVDSIEALLDQVDALMNRSNGSNTNTDRKII